jgi:cytochrome P450
MIRLYPSTLRTRADQSISACVDIVHDIRLGALSKLRYNPLAAKSQKTAFAYIDRFVDEALSLRQSQTFTEKQQSSQYIFLNELAKETDDREVLRDQILSVLLAGRDTTASLLSNMFWELAHHPEIYEKLREEVKGLQGRAPTYEELKQMQYLKFCLNECEFPSRSPVVAPCIYEINFYKHFVFAQSSQPILAKL